MDTKIDFKNPEFYENRELSWIKFDNRVLSEARDKSIPLLERLKFVSITSSNLDEFFMVRQRSSLPQSIRQHVSLWIRSTIRIRVRSFRF